MSTDELITRARKAIETGQPNLAQLYMRNAIEQTNQQRRELNPLGWQARQMAEGFKLIGDLLTQAGQGWMRFVESFGKPFASVSGIDRKTNYALVGPSK
ncbi:hypothetical protein [Glutamicibacter arilaitensis]|uniref:Uncharacterized protein n=1 Tax=Glutamicibacter arilaitensis TaxID=256701 RepID=A0A2N7RZI4_9MICC|nr:hypothetical protein [Glutamicibacter arilaitensis]PMQ19300.1 hypothetical protein CIK84_11355 [Glutamicibacter arilaitensis]